jgi:hypothetical protein
MWRHASRDGMKLRHSLELVLETTGGRSTRTQLTLSSLLTGQWAVWSFICTPCRFEWVLQAPTFLLTHEAYGLGPERQLQPCYDLKVSCNSSADKTVRWWPFNIIVSESHFVHSIVVILKLRKLLTSESSPNDNFSQRRSQKYPLNAFTPWRCHWY